MAEELELDLEDETVNRSEERIKNLSSKVREMAQERDEALKKVKEAETARVEAEKDKDFFSEFSSMSSKYQSASEHKDEIKEKVMRGYTVEDATVTVLNSKGQLTQTPQPQPEVAGGSAVVALGDLSEKPISQLSRDEKRALLLELEKRGAISG